MTNTDGNGNFEWASDKTTSTFNTSFGGKDAPTYDWPYVLTNSSTMLLNDRNELEINKSICQKDVDKNTGECEREGWILQKCQ